MASAPAQDDIEGSWRFAASDDTARAQFAGDDLRISIGVDEDFDLLGEALFVFGDDADSAWIIDGWLGNDAAGGVKLNYHWLSFANFEEAALDPSSGFVSKVFAAFDQNEFDDRKISAGYGIEKHSFFASLYGSAAISDERLININRSFDEQIDRFIEGNQEFTQTTTIETITSLFEEPYQWGIGARVGKYFEAPLLRARAGVDYEDGDFDSSQLTFSAGLEKYFRNTGHSLAARVEYLQKDGDFVGDDDDDTRWNLLYRYDFGNTYQPPRNAIETRTEVLEPATVVELRPVRNRVELSEEAYFAFDRSEIRPGAADTLRTVAQMVRSEAIVSNIEIVGHASPEGPDAYNQALSERRAQSAASFLVGEGVARARLEVSGRGENDPRYSNETAEGRARNRRVEIEFVSMVDASEEVEVAVTKPGTKWVREEITDPAWIARALRNPVQHKRVVDVYRYAETEERTEVGDPVLVNTFPEARDDEFTVAANASEVLLDVLANDVDEDGDTLAITAVSAASSGTVSIAGDRLRYVPAPGFVGTDTFSYTASDGSAEGSATVVVNVVNGAPVAQDDTVITQADTPVTIDVLANDSDPEGEPLTVVSVTDPDHGVAERIGNQVTYTPNAGFSGLDRFRYTIEDSFGNQAEAMVSVTVQAPPLPLVLEDDFATTTQGQGIGIDVLANDQGAGLEIVSTSAPANGFSTNLRTFVSYQPGPDFVGTDSFEYEVRDQFGQSATAVVTIEVRADQQENLPPFANTDEVEVDKDSSLTFDPLANDVDPEGDELQVVAVSETSQATVVVNADSTITYTPNPGWFGGDVLNYTIEDTAGNQAVGRIFVEVRNTSP